MAYPALPEQVDGWTDLQQQLDKRHFTSSRTFTIVFILLASFVFLSMFVGVMIIHTEVRPLRHTEGAGLGVASGAADQGPELTPADAEGRLPSLLQPHSGP